MGEFVTAEAAREQFRELADQVDAAYAQMRELSSDAVGNPCRVEMTEHLETQERTNRALMYRMFGQIADPADETAMTPRTDQQPGRPAAHPTAGGQTPDERAR